MPLKRLVRALLLTGVFAILTSVLQAQPFGAPLQQSSKDDQGNESNRSAIVGSWLGTVGETAAIASFTDDGVFSSSVQTEVGGFGEVATPSHGIWVHLGGRRFGITTFLVRYDLVTGEYLGFIKVRARLVLDKAGDQLNGMDKVELFDATGALEAAPPSSDVHYARIKFEPFN
jgi:hypothetical protein